MDQQVVFRVPLGKSEPVESVASVLTSTFGSGAKMQMVSESPVRWVIENEMEFESAIPSMSVTDRAFQEVETFPKLIENSETECQKMSRFIRAIITEIEELKTERERLEREIGEINNELPKAQIRRDVRQQHGKTIQRDAHRLIDKLLPPSETD